MRFDPERVLALAQEWPSPRLARSEGERLAADAIAGHFGRAGLSVERIESPPLNAPLGALVLVLALNACVFALVLTPGALRAGLMGLMLVSLLVAYRGAIRRERAAGFTHRPHHIIGRTPSPEPAPVRVVLVTLITTSRSRALPFWGLALGVLWVALAALACSPRFGREASLNPSLGLGLLLSVWLTLLLLLVLHHPRAAAPVRGDNRTGLALLVELARTLPERLGGRAEAWFVATPNPFALARELRRRSDRRRPTLVIQLRAPGVGELSIIGRGPAARLARAAARDLWIPHRSGLDFSGVLTGDSYRKHDLPDVSLRGAFDDRPINPALLAGTAQLVTELTLRWAKQAGAAVKENVGAEDGLEG